MTCLFEVRCYTGSKCVRVVHFWDLAECDMWVYINKDNYTRIVVHMLYK